MGRVTGSGRRGWCVFVVSLALVLVTGLVGSAVAVADDGVDGGSSMIGQDPSGTFSSAFGALGAGSVGRRQPHQGVTVRVRLYCSVQQRRYCGGQGWTECICLSAIGQLAPDTESI